MPAIVSGAQLPRSLPGLAPISDKALKTQDAWLGAAQEGSDSEKEGSTGVC